MADDTRAAVQPVTREARAPRRSGLDRPTAMAAAAHEYDRFHQALAELHPGDWQRPTVCAGWDVQAMAGHVLGMAELAASTREQVRQLLAARRAGGTFLDALTALQVAKHAGHTPEQITAALAIVGPKAAAGRRRTPRVIRNRRLPVAQEVAGVPENWTIGFLVDVILTRDTWMHRLDLATATGREPRLTAEHDGVLVADIVDEWAGRHHESCRLELSGPAGGSWSWGIDGPHLRLDAADFCRLVSGRGAGAGLLAVQVPF